MLLVDEIELTEHCDAPVFEQRRVRAEIDEGVRGRGSRFSDELGPIEELVLAFPSKERSVDEKSNVQSHWDGSNDRAERARRPDSSITGRGSIGLVSSVVMARLPRAPERERRPAVVELIADRRHYDDVVAAVTGAKVSVWIATANLKDVHLE